MTGDRLSKLPAEIIHDILRRLDSPDEAARTCVLSRIWYRQIWRSYPVVEYREEEEQISSDSRLASFTSSSCTRMSTFFVPNRIPLSALRISLLEAPDEERHSQLERLLESSSSLAAICGSPIEISVEILNGYYYSISSFEKLLRNCGRTRILKLRRCLVYPYFGSSVWADHLPNLESLSSLYTNLYSLEGSITIGRFKNCNLKSLEIEIFFVDFNEIIQITSAPLLERLALRLHYYKLIKIKLSSSSAAPNLKIVMISNHQEVKQEDIDALTFNLPSLQSLSFEKSKFLGGKCWLRVPSNSKLTKFGLTNCPQYFLDEPLQEIKIDAPNLSAFFYINQTSLLTLIRHVNTVSVASDFQFAVAVSTAAYYSPGQFFVRLNELLAPLLRSQQLHNVVLKLQGLEHFSSSEFKKYVMRNRELMVVKHLQLEVRSWTDSSWYLFDYCFSICRPKFVTIFQTGPINLTGRTQFLEYICKQPDRNSLNKCWRHQLKDAKIIENSGCETMGIHEAFDSSLSAEDNLFSSTFILTWHDGDDSSIHGNDSSIHGDDSSVPVVILCCCGLFLILLGFFVLLVMLAA